LFTVAIHAPRNSRATGGGLTVSVGTYCAAESPMAAKWNKTPKRVTGIR